MNRFALPLLIFISLTLLLWQGLDLNPRKIPSTLIDKSAPAFSLPDLHDSQKQITNATLANTVWVLNVWASWCVGCKQEHPVIDELAREIDIVGLNYKDSRENALNWLDNYGNPYLASAFDQAGNVGIDYGVYGVPETFVIDQQGQIKYKHIGPVSTADLSQTLLPIIQDLRNNTN